MADRTNRREDRTRQQLLDVLLAKVDADKYPSSTMLDLVEQLLTPDDEEAYVDVLMSKISDETYPSLSLVRRLLVRA